MARQADGTASAVTSTYSGGRHGAGDPPVAWGEAATGRRGGVATVSPVQFVVRGPVASSPARVVSVAGVGNTGSADLDSSGDNDWQDSPRRALVAKSRADARQAACSAVRSWLSSLALLAVAPLAVACAWLMAPWSNTHVNAFVLLPGACFVVGATVFGFNPAVLPGCEPGWQWPLTRRLASAIAFALCVTPSSALYHDIVSGSASATARSPHVALAVGVFTSSMVVLSANLCWSMAATHSGSSGTRVCLARLIVVSQFAFSAWFGGEFAKASGNIPLQVFLCALYPLVVGAVKSMSVVVCGRGHPDERRMLRVSSSLLAALPYRVLFLGFSSFGNLFAILGVELGFKLFKYVVLDLPAAHRARAFLRASATKLLPRQNPEPPNNGERGERDFATFDHEFLLGVLLHQTVDTVVLLAAVCLFSLVRWRATIGEAAFASAPIMDPSSAEWRRILLYFACGLVAELAVFPAALVGSRAVAATVVRTERPPSRSCAASNAQHSGPKFVTKTPSTVRASRPKPGALSARRRGEAVTKTARALRAAVAMASTSNFFAASGLRMCVVVLCTYLSLLVALRTQWACCYFG